MTVIARHRLLPANQSAFETAQATVSDRLLAVDVDAIRRARRPDQCDAAFVPLLGWERSVHFWKQGDEAGNRARIASSFGDHVLYGSPAALEAEIALDTGLSIGIVEFFQDPSLEWPDFIVQVNVWPGVATPDLAAVMAAAIRRKNVRDWPDRVRVHGFQPPGQAWFGAGVSASPKVRILPFDHLPRLPSVFTGAGLATIQQIRIRPLSH